MNATYRLSFREEAVFIIFRYALDSTISKEKHNFKPHYNINILSLSSTGQEFAEYMIGSVLAWQSWTSSIFLVWFNNLAKERTGKKIIINFLHLKEFVVKY